MKKRQLRQGGFVRFKLLIKTQGRIIFTTNTLHSHNTRFSEIGSFDIKYSRTNHFKHLFSIFGASIWNSIPQSIRMLPKFKVSLHQLLLRILELEDYVDTPTLVNKISIGL